MAIVDTQIDVRTRPPRESDAEPLFALFANWQVMRWLSSPPWPYTPDDARFSNPHGKDMLHVNTSLTRARFAATAF
jgi:RimJ/RimL family protein N-acetyltransferase